MTSSNEGLSSDVGIKIRKRIFESIVRNPVSVFAGVGTVDYVLPRVDHAGATAVAGCFKRFCQVTPMPDMDLIRELKEFTIARVRELLSPLSDDEVPSFEDYLEGTTYTKREKDDLRKTRLEMVDKWEDELHMVKAFIKDETYPEFKHARAIQGPYAVLKIRLARIYKAMEKKLFKLENFIKYVPVADRPRYLYDKLYKDDVSYMCIDFSAFESLINANIQEAVELPFYEYMSSQLNGGKAFLDVVRECQMGLTLAKFKWFDVVCGPRRRSGDQNTSLGNGWVNYIVLSFVAKKCGIEIFSLIEGDDSVSRVSGKLDSGVFERLGFRVKLEYVSNLSQAGFCQMYFDEEDRCVLADPRKVIASFGWLDKRYSGARETKLRCLARAKAMSIAYQYRGCPVLDVMAHRVLALTSGSDVRWVRQTLDVVKRELFDESFKNLKELIVLGPKPPGFGSRVVVESKFGVSVENQLYLEKYFSSIDYAPFSQSVLDMIMPSDWAKNAELYVWPVHGVDNLVLHVDKVFSEPHLQLLVQKRTAEAAFPELARRFSVKRKTCSTLSGEF